MMFTRYKTVMNAVGDFANGEDLLCAGAHLGIDENNTSVVVLETVENIGLLPTQQQDYLFVKVYEIFLYTYYEDASATVQRKNDLTCATAHNRMLKFNKNNR